MQNEPQLRCCCEIQEQNRLEQFNPIYLYTMLQMFSELDEAGFSINYHPKNFMTTVIPIIPSKLRPKTIVSSESTLTTYYKIIIEEDLSPDPSLLGYPLLSSLTLIELYLSISLFFSISYEPI